MKDTITKRSQTSKGFTIVELLVVIVVIAILAAITIVAYSGIQARAQNDVTVNAVAEYAKVIENYGTSNGTYPVVSYTCLGPSGTACGNMTNGTVDSNCNYIGNVVYSSTFDNAIKTQVPNPPAPSTQKMACDNISVAGAWYDYAPPSRPTATLIYYLNGSSTTCTAPSGTTLTYTYRSGSTAACYLAFPASS